MASIEPYRETYSFAIKKSKIRIATIVFDSKEASEESEVDKYDDCRGKIQAWLDKHFPGEVLETTGDDIERDGEKADIERDEIDMTTNAKSKKRPAEEAMTAIQSDALGILYNPSLDIAAHGVMCDAEEGQKLCPTPTLVKDSMDVHSYWTGKLTKGSGKEYVICPHPHKKIAKKRPAEEAKHEDESTEKKAKTPTDDDDETNAYRIKTKDLRDLIDGGDEVLTQLTNHLTRKDCAVTWPDEFRVTIRTKDVEEREDSDTDGLQFYASDSTKPFLKMGSSDDGFYLAAALMRAVGDAALMRTVATRFVL